MYDSIYMSLLCSLIIIGICETSSRISIQSNIRRFDAWCCLLDARMLLYIECDAFFPVFRNQWANMYCSVSSKGTSETTSAKWLMGSSDIWCNKIITLILDTISQCICHRIVAKNTISANSDCFFSSSALLKRFECPKCEAIRYWIWKHSSFSLCTYELY